MTSHDKSGQDGGGPGRRGPGRHGPGPSGSDRGGLGGPGGNGPGRGGSDGFGPEDPGEFAPDGGGSPHDAVGAYVLGVLDDTDAAAFEEHLAGCELCAARLAEFAGMEAMLAQLADGPAGPPVPRDPASREAPGSGRILSAVPVPGPGTVPAQTRSEGRDDLVPAASVRPSPQLLDRLVDEVGSQRARRRRRGFFLAAAAAVLIVGGPTAAVLATSTDQPPAASQAAGGHSDSAYFHALKDKVSATDPGTKVTATVALEPKAWGTDAVMELKNVKGPLKCSLIAVSTSGERQVVTSWAVPWYGYGVPGSSNPFARKPLYVHGGAAAQPKDIDHFDVMTSDGKRLVQIPA